MPTVLIVLLSVLVFFLALWVFLTAPGGKKKETLAFAKYKYAHRGLHNAERAENSLSAFAAAAEAGYGIELDVRLSKDGEVVVFHDSDLSRVTGVDRAVNELTAAELKALSLSGTSEGVPTFREVLDTVAGRVPILVEIKEEGAHDRAVTPAAMEILSEYRGAYLIEGFSPLSIRGVRKLSPRTVRGLLCQHFTVYGAYRTLTFRLLQHFLMNVLCRPQFIAFNLEHKKYFPFRLVRALYRVPSFAWTVRSEEEENACRLAGFDSVIFENYLPEKK